MIGAYDADVVIVGAGPAGCATALFMTAVAPELRARLLVLDKAEFPRTKICAGALARRADRLLAAVGVHIDVPGVPIRGLTVTTATGSLSARWDAPEPMGRVVSRLDFDAALLEAVRRRGILVRTGVKLLGLSRSGDSVQLETTAGTLRARAAIGADGAGSAVRRGLGLGRGRQYARAAETTSPHGPSHANRDQLHFDLSDRTLVGYGWTFPTLLDGAPAWSQGAYELVPLAGARPAHVPLVARVRSRLDRLSRGHRAETDRAGVPPRAHPVRQFAERGFCLHEPHGAPRVLLVGEAAGVDPVLGEGLAQAIGYGAVAGPYVAARLREGRLAFSDWKPTLLSSPVGRDLRRRLWALPHVYGAARPRTERWLSGCQPLATAGMHYFAGARVPRGVLVRALLSLVWSSLWG